jgi:cyclopropane-fatty-acyl-phospholipid synthase
VFTVRSPAAWRARCSAPGQLGIERAYVAGLLEVDDLDAALDLLAERQPPPLHRSIRARLALAAPCGCGLTLPPPVPAAGLRPGGRRHSPARDARAVRHHYDLSDEFFALFLAPADRHEHRACRSTPARREDVEEAQRAKLELVCDKLALGPGERVLRRLRLGQLRDPPCCHSRH